PEGPVGPEARSVRGPGVRGPGSPGGPEARSVRGPGARGPGSPDDPGVYATIRIPPPTPSTRVGSYRLPSCA
ncbi:hypothetical protein EF902_49165, partial [Streptomyces sp. WAC05858]